MKDIKNYTIFSQNKRSFWLPSIRKIIPQTINSVTYNTDFYLYTYV